LTEVLTITDAARVEIVEARAGEDNAGSLARTPAAQAFAALAECIVTEAIPLIEMVTCTARQFFKAAGLLNPMPEPQAHGGYQDPTN
jgi:hypothetical protein